MLFLNLALLALSTLPSSHAKPHHRTHSLTTSTHASTHSSHPSTFTTHNATISASSPLTTPSHNPSCPTITHTVAKTKGICPDIRCLPQLVDGRPFVATSTFEVGCGCPAATPTATLSQCDTGCQVETDWLYKTAGGC